MPGRQSGVSMGLRVGVGAKVVEMKKIGKFAVSSFIGNVKFLVSE